MSIIEEKIEALGLSLPKAAKPVAVYVPAVKSNDLIFTAGQLPSIDGKLITPGGVGKVNEQNKEAAKKAAEVATLNALAAIKLVAESLDHVKQILKVTVFVASESGFSGQPFVANGASELLEKVFEKSGIHARSAVGVSELPLNASVEVELIASLNSNLI
ncbi:Endoribonuclease L-PSP [Chloroherpeton thalassium ATCC 35110]|uniref:Endoribonuclease L-PSP n=1 Tax=Chloroherpeton thalassium (strain ATCC 35110 / GB-78) TaxID=517418 RepID=B3QTW0_CHLT3|nr:RidA family protein [Chloroherpeton thalassium]ACF14308.1 Endoribonuclease L-PSP [Chloroherpeton thalassium ATCC 35110]